MVEKERKEEKFQRGEEEFEKKKEEQTKKRERKRIIPQQFSLTT